MSPEYKPHGKLGGTSIAALLGEDSFGKTAYDVYNGLLGGARVTPNRYMARGVFSEQRVRELYVEQTGAVLEPHPGVVHWRECFAASVDDLRTRYTLGPVDYKTASAKSKSKWKHGMLTSYEWQLRLYMAVFDSPEADLFVAFGNDIDCAEHEPGAFAIGNGEWARFEIVDSKLFTVQRDAAKEERLIEVGEAFWRDHVVPRIPPPGPQLAPPQRLDDTTLSEVDLKVLDSPDSFSVVLVG